MLRRWRKKDKGQAKESNVAKSDAAKRRTVKRGTPVSDVAYPMNEDDCFEDDAARSDVSISIASGIKVA